MKKTAIFMFAILLLSSIVFATGFRVSTDGTTWTPLSKEGDKYNLLTDGNGATTYLLDYDAETLPFSAVAGIYPLYLKNTTADKSKILDFYNAKPEPYKTFLIDALNGINGFAMIDTATMEILDSAYYTLASARSPMRIPGNYEKGVFYLEASVPNVNGSIEIIEYVLRITNLEEISFEKVKSNTILNFTIENSTSSSREFNYSVEYPSEVSTVESDLKVDGLIKLNEGYFPFNSTFNFSGAIYTVLNSTTNQFWVSECVGAIVRPLLKDDSSYKIQIGISGLDVREYDLSIELVASKDNFASFEVLSKRNVKFSRNAEPVITEPVVEKKKKTSHHSSLLPTQSVNYGTEIKENEPTLITVANKKGLVQEIEIISTVAKKINVQTRDIPYPIFIERPKGELKYFEINVFGIEDEEIKSAKIRFDYNGTEDVILQRYHDGIWNILPTTKISENKYEAITPGFSTYAVTKKPEQIVFETPVKNETVVIIPETPKDELKNEEIVPETPKEEPKKNISEPIKEPNYRLRTLTIGLTAIFLIAVLAIIGIFVSKKNKKESNEE